MYLSNIVTKQLAQVTDAVARMLHLPRTPATRLGSVEFNGTASTMYAVAGMVVAACQQPAGKTLSDFQHYCERALSNSLSNKSMSLPTPDSGSIGHHDDLISWLPRGVRSASVDCDRHSADVQAPACKDGINAERVAVQQAMANNGAWGLRFSSAALEDGFGVWLAGVMYRVDVVGALLSLVLLSAPAVQLGLVKGGALLGPPAAVLTLAVCRRHWYVVLWRYTLGLFFFHLVYSTVYFILFRCVPCPPHLSPRVGMSSIVTPSLLWSSWPCCGPCSVSGTPHCCTRVELGWWTSCGLAAWSFLSKTRSTMYVTYGARTHI